LSDETKPRKTRDLTNAKSNSKSNAMTKADSEELERAQDIGLQSA